MVYGYLLSNEEKIGQDYRYYISSPDLNFFKNHCKIAPLLILNNKVQRIEFDLNDSALFEEMGNNAYLTAELRNDAIRRFASEVLFEQSIIAGVSYWECYFSDIFENILNDDALINRLFSTDRTKLNKFLKKFNLGRDFQNISLNESRINGLKFGTYITKNKKISFQDLNNVKSMFKILFNCSLVKINERGWTEIAVFFKDRHEIVHNANNQHIIAKYSEDKIKRILRNMIWIIRIVDEYLFTNYSPRSDVSEEMG